MPNVKIEGALLEEFTVNGENFFAYSPRDYQARLREITAHNYNPMEGVVVLGRGSQPWLLRVEKDTEYRGQGNRVSEVIDCQTMYSVANHGHGNMNILVPVTEYLLCKWAPTGNGLTNRLQLPAFEALRALSGLNARVMAKVGGAEAVETAIKIARRVWWARNGKRVGEEGNPHVPYIIVALNAFHGRTLGVTALFPRGSSSRKGFGPFPDSTLWVPLNNIVAMEKTLETHRGLVAGVLLEPIQGEGGIIIPDDEYLPQVEKLCRKHGVLFILDEIQTGFGRTGKNFAFEHYGVTPDILTVAKALGGGALPASAIIGRKDVVFDGDPKIYDMLAHLAIDGSGEDGATWSGAAEICMAVLASIKELCDRDLAALAAENGTRFISELKALQKRYPVITEVRGKGLMVGVDFSIPGRALSHALLEEGVWAYYTGSEGRTIRFLPPLATPPIVLSEVVARLERALVQFLPK